MLEKKINLRRIEFIFTDDQIHEECHCEYNLIITEDGQEISRQNHRSMEKTADAIGTISAAKTYVQPEEPII